MLGLQAVLFCVSKLVNVMLTIFTVVMYFAETCNHILQILAFSLPMIVKECIFWLTTDHGWETLVHGEHTFGNWWLPRLLNTSKSFEEFACSICPGIKVFNLFAVKVVSFCQHQISKRKKGRKRGSFSIKHKETKEIFEMVLVDWSSDVIKKESCTACEEAKEFFAIQQWIAQNSVWLYLIWSCLD